MLLYRVGGSQIADVICFCKVSEEKLVFLSLLHILCWKQPVRQMISLRSLSLKNKYMHHTRSVCYHCIHLKRIWQLHPNIVSFLCIQSILLVNMHPTLCYVDEVCIFLALQQCRRADIRQCEFDCRFDACPRWPRWRRSKSVMAHMPGVSRQCARNEGISRSCSHKFYKKNHQEILFHLLIGASTLAIHGFTYTRIYSLRCDGSLR